VQSYSTDRVESAKSGAVDTSASVPKKKEYHDDPERRAEYLRKLREYDAHSEYLSKQRERMLIRRLQPEVRLDSAHGFDDMHGSEKI
ncbi:unnamed protein product, partial [Aureobasidium mustum]